MTSTTPPGSPPRPTTFLLNPRSPKSGTTKDIKDLELMHPDLKSSTSYHTHTHKHFAIFREMSDKLAEADRYFRVGRWHLCRLRCNDITGAEGSAAIQARAFMLLAKREITFIASDRS